MPTNEKEDFDKNTKFLDELIELTKRVTDPLTSAKDDDWFGRMIVSFLFKQLDHAISIYNLGPSKDTILIARTMIEGFLRLAWVKENPPLAEKWHKYSVVSDWKLLLAKEENGTRIDPAYKAQLFKRLQQEGTDFIKSKKPPYSYHDNFLCGLGMGAIAKDLAGKYPVTPVLYSIFSDFSDWVHWGTGSVLGSTIDNQGNLTYYEQDYVYSDAAITAAFLSLMFTVYVADEHFKLNSLNLLEKLNNDYNLAMK